LLAEVNQVQTHEDWEETSQEIHVIGLLQLICNCMYSGVATKCPEHMLIDTQTKMFTFWQTSQMPNAKYLWTFHGLVDTIESIGRDVGVDYTRITEYLELIQQDPDNPAKWVAVKAVVQEKYLGTLFAIKSNSKHYSTLIALRQNDFISRHDCYPNTLNAAYTMLVNYVNPSRKQTFDIQDSGLSYFNNEEEEDSQINVFGKGAAYPE
jgi:hypothetical protein